MWCALIRLMCEFAPCTKRDRLCQPSMLGYKRITGLKIRLGWIPFWICQHFTACFQNALFVWMPGVLDIELIDMLQWCWTSGMRAEWGVSQPLRDWHQEAKEASSFDPSSTFVPTFLIDNVPLTLAAPIITICQPLGFLVLFAQGNANDSQLPLAQLPQGMVLPESTYWTTADSGGRSRCEIPCSLSQPLRKPSLAIFSSARSREIGSHSLVSLLA